MLGAKANRAAKQTSPEVHALGLFAFAQQVRVLKCPVRRWQLVRAVPPVSILSVVVNAQADAITVSLHEKHYRGLLMPEISTGHHNPTCYLRKSVERRRINVTGTLQLWLAWPREKRYRHLLP